MNFADHLSVKTINSRLGNHVAQSGDKQLAAHKRDVGDHVLTLGHQGLPFFYRRILHADLDDAVVFGLVVGERVEIVAVILDGEAVIDAVNNGEDRRVRSAQILGIDIHARGGNAVINLDNQIAVIFRNLGADQL